MHSRKRRIEHDNAKDFSEKGLLPKNLTPTQWDGTASDENYFVFFEEQLEIRAKNEKEFQL